LQLVDTVHIGRSPQCELILDDDFVSATHAVLAHQPNGVWVLTDMGSTNGTYVNGRRISEPTIVTMADAMRIGRVQMRLDV
jgi:pSer/pThr/pTyr-binding forkhead associated (FHA) protein